MNAFSVHQNDLRNYNHLNLLRQIHFLFHVPISQYIFFYAFHFSLVQVLKKGLGFLSSDSSFAALDR